MKKLISLLLALILLVSAAPAFAASSLKPEDIIGTWELYYLENNGQVTTAKDLKALKASQTIQFHADGTGKMVSKDRFDSTSINMVWKIQGNTVRCDLEDAGCLELKKMGKDLGSSYVFNSGDTFKHKFRKTKDTTGKKAKTAILSTGTYNLNNSKKTAVFVSPSPYTKSTTLKIPDTIKVQGITYKVVEIASKACAGNLLLTTVTIGKNIKTIGANAFNGCKALRKITFTGTSLSKVKASAFDGIRSKATVTCPKAKLSKYQKLLKKAGIPKTAKFKAK